MKRKLDYLFETEKGEVVSRLRDQNGKGNFIDEGAVFFVGSKIADLDCVNLDLVEDLADILDLKFEREVFQRIHCLLPYKDGPMTIRGIAREMGLSRFKVKKTYRQIMKKIRRVIYEEAKTAHDERQPGN